MTRIAGEEHRYRFRVLGLPRRNHVRKTAEMDDEITWWPDDAHAIDGELGIVSVNYNTAHLISLLIWSIHRFVPPASFNLVVVDNGSTDDSIEILRLASDAGLCHLVANPANRYHGPALNQGLSELARRHRAGTPIRWVWLLDSDSVIARSNSWSKLEEAATAAGAGMLGEPHWDEWHNIDTLHLASLLLDPAIVWRRGRPPFQEDGDPLAELHRSCVSDGIRIESFPMFSNGYVIHRGRGTLERVAETFDTANKYYSWAVTHREPHFATVPRRSTDTETCSAS
jgi:glycosyltransferase involved in cell wall biosynthesis